MDYLVVCTVRPRFGVTLFRLRPGDGVMPAWPFLPVRWPWRQAVITGQHLFKVFPGRPEGDGGSWRASPSGAGRPSSRAAS
jgi:hypothetical protein